VTTSAVTLENETVRVVILPDKGCDVYELRDVHSGIDVLAKTRLGLADLQTQKHSKDSTEAWLSQYLGGWQLILPNGGGAAIVDGVEWGFHGEACVLRWNVEELPSATLQASVRLTCAPIFVRRRFELSGRTLILREHVTNESERTQSLMWAQHPAFGAPFLDESCEVSTGASVLTADDVSPGTFLTPGSKHPWPNGIASSGTRVKVDEVPGARSGVACLAYLSEFSSGYFAITNPNLGLGVAFRWPTEIFPVAWYWIEAGAAEGFPWFGDHYTLAIEPATSAPAQGMNELIKKGGAPLVIEPGETVEATFEVTLFHDARRVVKVGADGAVDFESRETDE
jgi:hypothetical protein